MPTLIRIRLVGTELFHVAGRTDGHDEADTLRNFAKAASGLLD
jgi:hypothetical protein